MPHRQSIPRRKKREYDALLSPPLGFNALGKVNAPQSIPGRKKREYDALLPPPLGFNVGLRYFPSRRERNSTIHSSNIDIGVGGGPIRCKKPNSRFYLLSMDSIYENYVAPVGLGAVEVYSSFP